MSAEDRPTKEQRLQIDALKARLDVAVSEYYYEISKVWANDNPGMVMGWVLGLSLAAVDEDDDETNALQIESSPGLNNFTARGIADSTAEAFAAQAYGE